MAAGDESLVHLIHTVWSGVLTALGGLIVWNWNRLVKEVDKKVDRSEITQLREDLRQRWQAQDQVQKESRTRLDAIYKLLARRVR